jgi:WD repeat-containing protein 26
MRPADSSQPVISNGHSVDTNGSTPKKPVQTVVNGHDKQAVNGSDASYTNGTSKKKVVSRPSLWEGHAREEVTRILIQGLTDLGYSDTAQSLVQESGYELESPSVAAFRSAVLDGAWSDAESILLGLHSISDSEEQPHEHGLVLAEGADRGQMLFWIRQQKFLELLDRKELSQALTVLRTELTPLEHDVHQLHALSSLLMCPPEDLRTKAHWPDTIEDSRERLLKELSASIAPSVMIREHRLAELFEQVKRAQINSCLYHNTSLPPSLYSDHHCNREDFPLRTGVQLEEHSDEVFHVRFSPDGTKLASASMDKTAIIYDVANDFAVLHKLEAHDREVTSVAWSPDSSKLITCSKDSKARVWDAETGNIIRTYEHRTSDNNYAITEAAWHPDNHSFVTASHDRKNTLCYWNMESHSPIHVWPDTFRTDSAAITPDGERVVVADTDARLRCFELRRYREEFCIQLPCRMTAISISQDSTCALLNLTHGEVHMLDLRTRETVRKFVGQQQGQFVIRNCFGGAAENFVLSGSEGELTWQIRLCEC